MNIFSEIVEQNVFAWKHQGLGSALSRIFFAQIPIQSSSANKMKKFQYFPKVFHLLAIGKWNLQFPFFSVSFMKSTTLHSVLYLHCQLTCARSKILAPCLLSNKMCSWKKLTMGLLRRTIYFINVVNTLMINKA